MPEDYLLTDSTLSALKSRLSQLRAQYASRSAATSMRPRVARSLLKIEAARTFKRRQKHASAQLILCSAAFQGHLHVISLPPRCYWHHLVRVSGLGFRSSPLFFQPCQAILPFPFHSAIVANVAELTCRAFEAATRFTIPRTRLTRSRFMSLHGIGTLSTRHLGCSILQEEDVFVPEQNTQWCGVAFKALTAAGIGAPIRRQCRQGAQ